MEDRMIHYILENNIQKLVNIVENGANIHYLNDYPFILACSKGYASIVSLIINCYNPNINAQNGLPLRIACIYGHMDIVICLIENGVDINIDDSGALIWCAYKGQNEIAKYLISKGADISARNNLLMKIYSGKKNIEILDFLWKL